MNYFEIRERLKTLHKMRRLYKEYLSFTNRFENPAAQIIISQMRPLVPMTIESLKYAGVGSIVTHDAPSKGGKRYKINIIKAIFRESLTKNFSLDDNGPLEAIEAALAKYRVLLTRARLQLFNPIFWLVQFVGYAISSPFFIMQKCGIDTADFEKTSVGRMIKLIIALAMLYLISEASGFSQWLRGIV